MANRRNVSSNRDDILEQWLNAEVDSDEDEIGRNSPTFRNNVPTRTTNSENEFSDDQEEFVITSDHDSNSEMSEGEDTSPDEEAGEQTSSTGYFYMLKQCVIHAYNLAHHLVMSKFL